jgi:farnesyl-diphosphate farnesyltransferase
LTFAYDFLVINKKQAGKCLLLTMETSRLRPDLLKNVSRSFYLTLRVLPSGLREPVALAYLLARAADTIADTPLIPAQHRIELLLALRAHVGGNGNRADLDRMKTEVARHQTNSHEGELLSNLEPLLAQLNEFPLADSAAIRQVVTTLTTGMEADLRNFPDERSGKIAALDTQQDLDRYTYLVAGCVGEFWTKMTHRHRPELAKWDVEAMAHEGIRFGKALQMTNILRDCPKDLRIGRCYLPRELLAPLGLAPEDLLAPDTTRAARPLLHSLMRQTLEHFGAAERYLLAIPASSARLRLACLWPILIGLETLLLLARGERWLDPAHPSKVGRSRIYRIIALSLPAVGSNAILGRWIQGLHADIEAQLNKP